MMEIYQGIRYEQEVKIVNLIKVAFYTALSLLFIIFDDIAFSLTNSFNFYGKTFALEVQSPAEQTF